MNFAISLPEPLVAVLSFAIAAFVTKLIVDGLASIGEVLGKDLSKPAKIVAAIVSGAIVTATIESINALLGFIPLEYEPIAQAVLSLLVTLAAMGIHRAEKLARVS